jgi:23S rRNA (uracil1939-C5)-methyltransferase
MSAQAPVATVVIEGIDPSGDGAGYATIGRRHVLIDDVIPGERVEVRLYEDISGLTRGELVRVLVPSPHRVTPMCRYAGSCGGCAWQHIRYAEQLRLKRDMVATLLGRGLGPGAPAVQDVLTPGLAEPAAARPEGPAPLPSAAGGGADGAAPRGFRNKAHFVFAPENRAGGLVMGHYRRRSQEVVAVEECPVHDPRGNHAAFAVRDALRLRRIEAAVPGTGRGLARHVVVRVAEATGERLVTLVVTRNDRTLRPAVRRVLDGSLAPESLHLNVHGQAGPYLFGQTTLRLHGTARIREIVAGVSFLISPTAFFQTNVGAAQTLVRVVLEYAGASARVLDLYAGAGLFALPLATGGARVTAVEENAEAIEDGEASRRLNGIPASACRFIRARVDRLAASRGQVHIDSAPDLVVLDPPRQGCTRSVLDWLAGTLQPSRIIYVSCNPEALASELGILLAGGYACRAVRPVDMFPHAAHIETVAVLDRPETKRTPGRTERADRG